MTAAANGVVCFCADLDNTLSLPNRPPAEDVVAACQILTDRGVQVVLVSGKALDYLWRVAERFGGRVVVAENGAVYQVAGTAPVVFEPENKDLSVLRKALGLGAREVGVTAVTVGNRSGLVAVEEGKLGVLTLFCEPAPVRHRWPTFERGGFDRHELADGLRALIRTHGLRLHVLRPHADGAVDVVRLDRRGEPITKAVLPRILDQAFGKHRRTCMLGDAVNDLPAMTAPGILPVTFANAESEVIRAVESAGGIVTERPAPLGGGVAEAIRRLARDRTFFGADSPSIAADMEEILSRV